jgi:penicillin V acylase-like amidase (Ntn superfamily)
MCTSVAFTQMQLFGRNLDLEYSFGEQVVITPRNHPFTFHFRSELTRHYAMIGMATVAEDTALYAEATNEKGLYMAGLNFPGNAKYFPTPSAEKENLAPYELIPRILGTCETLAEAKAVLENVQVAAIPFKENYPLAPLHWHIADSTGCLVAESMEDGMHIYEDSAGVLTNNPPFPFHQMNLNQYMGLSPKTPENTFAPALPLAAFGQGMGGLGLPGDTSPASRYVRAAFHKTNAAFSQDRTSQITQFFHILDAVAMVRGTVITPEGKLDETTYSCCMDGKNGTYYYKTYENPSIQAVSMENENLEESCLFSFPLQTKAKIHWANKPAK